ncbi:alpha/beta fold hydrolase [Sphaerisporangium sp. TRM90804]|uniref:alpha/beta fold hydrolase n=1 Tax=Sphaerisporangium sp. TRM90804 TaxID=3031113 RepID=UPI00244BF077|nr:alpha/beta fold hydrolase [Sphaerisporangium sp. TRM90804]MDH2424614.1 alpha/beta fold hydrolase [Sphaerisporangium sp. TRM90804]
MDVNREDHRMVDAGAVRLAYRVSGAPDARPLLLLHALGEGAADWAGVVEAFTAHRRVYAVELRGHGRSEWPGEYSLDSMRDDVLGLMDALGLDQVDVIGHSLGGLVAYLVASERPERVRRLVLEDVGVPLPREPGVPARPEGDLPFDWEMVLAVREQIDTPDPRWLERLGRITARTLVVAGGPASHIPQERVAELARRIPDGRLVTIPAGHLVHAAEPEAFAEAVLPFLRAESPR